MTIMHSKLQHLHQDKRSHSTRSRPFAAFLWFELRQSISWSWLLPIVLILGSFGITRMMPVPSGMTPDYATNVRSYLEWGLPLAGIFLTVHLLAQEWMQGTLAQLALRQPLICILSIRLCLVFIYLGGCTILATFLSLSITALPTDIQNNSWRWIFETGLTILPSTFAICTLALLVAHLMVSNIAGYILGIVVWLVNFMIPTFLGIMHVPREDRGFLIYLLFGWNDRMLTAFPQDWWHGKLFLLLIASLLLICQIIVLKREARLIRNVEE